MRSVKVLLIGMGWIELRRGAGSWGGAAIRV